MIQTLLQSASYALIAGDKDHALNYLSAARKLARQGKTIRCRVIAVHCTVAMQAILPLQLEYQLAWQS
jgi:archaellum biogenesis ATPase FlaH